ncbi:hypothetical protein RJ639_025868 [Escallonia herrerae]|uniref:Retrotransposon gag domain-containing protein n=1 Tax=Escallonia herrerae TaxID=1293975 RepID=A0AA88UT62_9ASTE|nr:hypothetical protein RJ639_025868 [Escallonia herrerae]
MSRCFSIAAAVNWCFKYSNFISGLRSTLTDLGDGTVMHCWVPKIRRESKPNLLLIHGFGANSMWQWSDTVSRMSPHFNIYVRDLVFFGYSFTTRPDRSESFQALCVMRVMEQNSVRRMRVVGLSYGGFVAYSMAAQFGEAVEKLVICCAGVCLEEKDVAAGLFPVRDVEEAADILVPCTAEKMRELLRYTFVRPPKGLPSCFLDFIDGHRVSGGIRAAVAQGTVASAKKILWDSLLRKTMANTKERIDALEAQIHDMFKSNQDAPGILKQFSLRLDALEVNLEATDNTRYAESMEWEGKFQELQDRVEHRARHIEVVNTPAGGAEHLSRPRVPEPKSYGGARDAKELENFLFDIEQYFRAIRVDSEVTKVSMAAMYLVGDAKLWWRKKYAEIEDGSCVINTWEILKRELKSQFFPENTAFNARKALLECKQTGLVREYCQAFSALMLDISDMSAVDRLFFFMEGLKPWARTELNRRRVNNLNEAIIAVESLSDYNSEPQRPPQRGNPSRGIGGKKPGGLVPNQSWGSKSSWASNSSTQQKSGVGFKAKPNASTSGEVKKPPFRGCFLCNVGNNLALDQGIHLQMSKQTQDYEEEDAVGAFPQWCNAVTTKVGNPKKSLTGEEPKDMPPKKKGDVPGKGLMYVDIKLNGKAIRAMVDT